MSKSMIGFDPLAWLSPDTKNTASAKKNAKNKSTVKSKKKVTKKVAAKKASPGKAVSKKSVVKKKIVSKKTIDKKATPKKSEATEKIAKKKVNQKNVAIKKTNIKKPAAKYISPLGLDVETLEASFNLLVPQAENLVTQFYNKLFEQHPDVVPMFKNTTQEEQQKKLLAALNLVIKNIRKPDVLTEALNSLGSKHQSYGAEPAHYAAVAATLISVMQAMAGDAWTKQMQSAWEHALSTIADVMLAAYEKTEVNRTPSSETKIEEITVNDSMIKLYEVQDISQVAELHKRVSGLLNVSDIIFDGTEVERIDAASLQVLTGVFIHANTYGSNVSWKGASDTLKKSAELLGLTRILHL